MAGAGITVFVQEPIARINPNLYGHFVEHVGGGVYDGIWVGEDSSIANLGGIRRDVVDAVRELHPPVIRWPGGCFADDYHWRDGIGPRETRPARVNMWWGRADEPNSFGTHEFVHFCRLVGAQPYIAGNLGSGSPQEMRDWVEYCNHDGCSALARQRTINGSPEPFRVRYWGVGNEPWGCGGTFSPEDYALAYKRFANYLRDFGGTPLYLVAAGPGNDQPAWTRRFFIALDGQCRPQGYCRMHGCAVHYYCGHAGTDVGFSDDQWYELLHRSLMVEPHIVQQRAVMDEFDPEGSVDMVLDEYGVWHPPSPGVDPCSLWRQNTQRDALAAAIMLDVLNRQAHRVAMANIAQMVNVLHAMVFTEGDRMVTTPTYHVFRMYRSHQGGQSVRTVFAADDVTFVLDGAPHRLPGLLGSASLRDGTLTLSVVNTHIDTAVEAGIQVRGAGIREATTTTLTAPEIRAHNTFDAPDTVVPATTRVDLGGKAGRHTFPPASVTVLSILLGRR